MTVNTALAISALSLLCAIAGLLYGVFRNGKSDSKSDTSALTTVIVKLENISEGISEIKSDQRNIKNELKELRDRVICSERDIEAFQLRLDVLERK